MDVIVIMSLGIVIGLFVFPRKYIKHNNILQLIAIMLTIFCMGVGLGSSPTFIDDLVSAGVKSLVYSFIPILFSVIFVYFLTRIFLKGGIEDDNDNGGDK